MSNLRKTISFGKFAIESPNRKDNEITVDIEYGDETGHGRPRFSVCGYSWMKNHTDCIHGGQCLDELNSIVCHSDISIEKLELWKQIYGLWKRNHLNDMNAFANEVQEEAVNECIRMNGGKYDYDKVCEYLKEKGIYHVYVNGEKCGYGEKWYYKPISESDQKLIEKILAEN